MHCMQVAHDCALAIGACILETVYGAVKISYRNSQIKPFGVIIGLISIIMDIVVADLVS